MFRRKGDNYRKDGGFSRFAGASMRHDDKAAQRREENAQTVKAEKERQRLVAQKGQRIIELWGTITALPGLALEFVTGAGRGDEVDEMLLPENRIGPDGRFTTLRGYYAAMAEGGMNYVNEALDRAGEVPDYLLDPELPNDQRNGEIARAARAAGLKFNHG